MTDKAAELPLGHRFVRCLGETCVRDISERLCHYGYSFEEYCAKPEAAHRTKDAEHLCGLQGFGRGGPEALADRCPACQPEPAADKARKLGDHFDKFGWLHGEGHGHLVRLVREVAEQARKGTCCQDCEEHQRHVVAEARREEAAGFVLAERLLAALIAEHGPGRDVESEVCDFRELVAEAREILLSRGVKR